MSELTCGFIGLGLIGGSIAKALKEYNSQIRIVAFDVNSETLRLAKQDSVADIIASSIDESFSECDYIFLCAPVRKNDENLAAVKKIMSPKCLLTDVGSVKSTIHNAIREAGLEHCFIGGHPMAGNERTGYVNSKAALLENAYYILTPTPSVPAEKLEAYRELTEKTGAIPLILDYQKHDYVTAAVSHLPHVIAAALVNLVRDSDSKDGIMKMIAAGGFKDITRIASSSPEMWQQICLTNADHIAKLLRTYIQYLEVIADYIDDHEQDSLYNFFDTARNYRESFISTPSGPIKAEYVLTVDIADKPGAIAAIASLLAMHDVSIKNIGINHNRELAEGALRIEFYSQDTLSRAMEVMTEHGYKIHTR